MIISAKTISIGSKGTINSNAGGDSADFKPAFLNNFPALGDGQYGYVWDPNTAQYKLQYSGSWLYHYNTGVGFDCNAYVPYSAWERTGGAGIALGYKLD